MEAYLRNHKETVHGVNLLANKIHFLQGMWKLIWTGSTFKDSQRNYKEYENLFWREEHLRNHNKPYILENLIESNENTCSNMKHTW